MQKHFAREDDRFEAILAKTRAISSVCQRIDHANALSEISSEIEAIESSRLGSTLREWARAAVTGTIGDDRDVERHLRQAVMQLWLETDDPRYKVLVARRKALKQI